ncbi:hypothetical protein [Candidatus Lucifugimonas marina]|uniref:hypothetical protein n=1 Tax=Candidatus Lucifugimonas marina TaxID=3038979 RepID=UPI00319E1ABA
MTGLETAIILIAFVVVASVFSFTMLSTGVFASGQTKESILSALDQVSGSIILRGSVIASKGRLGTTVDSDTVFKVSFVVTASPNGAPVDMTPPYTVDSSGIDPDFDAYAGYKTVISYMDQNQHLPDVPWTGKWVGENNSDESLDSGESMEISVWLLRRDIAAQPSRATANYGVAYWSGFDANGSTGMSSENVTIERNTKFSIEIKPEYGSTLTVQRRAPTILDTVMNLR